MANVELKARGIGRFVEQKSIKWLLSHTYYPPQSLLASFLPTDELAPQEDRRSP